jgi:hypothetical protein
MFGEFLDIAIAAAGENMKKFRQTDSYLKRFNCFGEKLKCYMELEEDGKKTEGLEQLMLEAYRFMKFLRISNNINRGISKPEMPIPRPVDMALFEVVSLLDEPLENCVPIYMEANALEVFSYSIWVQLKQFGKIKYCKYCQANLFDKCKQHKEASSVADLIYCKGCTGWIENICACHGPEACINGDEVFDVLS